MTISQFLRGLRTGHASAIRHAAVLFLCAACCAGSADAQKSRPKKLPPLKIPSWYATVPKDKDQLFARGREESADMQTSLDKAALMARTDLGAQAEHAWQDIVARAQREIPGLRAPTTGGEEVKLSGSSIRYQKSVKRGSLYTAFVLVAWPRAGLTEVLRARAIADREWYDAAKNTKAVSALMR